jgi:hypothetical protein
MNLFLHRNLFNYLRNEVLSLMPHDDLKYLCGSSLFLVWPPITLSLLWHVDYYIVMD